MNIIKKYYVKKFVKQIDKTIKVKFGKRLECEPTENTIYVNNITDKTDIKTFNEYIKELNNKCNFNSFILGILHEIGHIYTYEEQSEEEYNKDIALLSLLFQENKLTAEQVNYFYLRLPLESNATKWAIDFAMQNARFCRYYQNKIGKEISK